VKGTTLRNSKTLAKLRTGKPVRICSLGHFIPPYIRLASHFGYECIWLDLEHRAMSEREVQSLSVYFHLYDIDCMLRAPTLENARLYRYLEDGAAGLMIPRVSTADEARALVNAIKFPPLGDRGLDGAGLDADFYLQGETPTSKTPISRRFWSCRLKRRRPSRTSKRSPRFRAWTVCSSGRAIWECDCGVPKPT